MGWSRRRLARERRGLALTFGGQGMTSMRTILTAEEQSRVLTDLRIESFMKEVQWTATGFEVYSRS